jgi:hypothetical protein
MMNTLFKPARQLAFNPLLSSILFRAPMYQTPMFASQRFAFSTNQQQRIYGEKVKISYPDNFAKDILAGPQFIQVRRNK